MARSRDSSSDDVDLSDLSGKRSVGEEQNNPDTRQGRTYDPDKEGPNRNEHERDLGFENFREQVDDPRNAPPEMNESPKPAPGDNRADVSDQHSDHMGQG